MFWRIQRDTGKVSVKQGIVLREERTVIVASIPPAVPPAIRDTHGGMAFADTGLVTVNGRIKGSCYTRAGRFFSVSDGVAGATLTLAMVNCV